MNDKVKVTTTRPILFEGRPQTAFETTELHRRELAARGLLEPATGSATTKAPTTTENRGEAFVSGKAADVIAAIEGADKDLLVEAFKAEKAKGDKARSTVIEALTAAIDG